MAKIVSKKNKLYTLMIVPHAKQKVSQWRIPLWSIHTLLAVIASIFLVTIYFGYTYYQMANEVKELERVRLVADQQQSQISQLEAKIEELNDETLNMQEKLAEVRELEVIVREMVGLEQREEADDITFSQLSGPRVQALSSARGGDNSVFVEDVWVNLENVDMIIGNTTDDLGQLVEDVAKRLEYLDAVPSRWPVTGRVTSGFGYRQSPFGGGREFHNGIDVAAPTGTSVKAAGKGKVIFAGWRAGYGNTVIIDHGYGFKSLYAHNSRILVKSGQMVEPEEIIARVGSTGRSTGPHLHFTIEVNGKAVNPYNYLQ